MDKPFGNLVDGAKPAKNNWPGICFPGGFGHNGDKPVMVYNNTYSQWLPNGETDIIEEPILQLDDSPGAAIPLPNNRIAVVIKDDV